jgi:L-lactate dehydrogenase (cytochrome)
LFLEADVVQMLALLGQSMVSWPDLHWIREAWGGPIVVKGVHTGDDARRAVDAGANALLCLITAAGNLTASADATRPA